MTPTPTDPRREAEIASRKLASLGLKTRYSVKEKRLYVALPVTDPTFVNPWRKERIAKVVLRNEGHERLKPVFPEFLASLSAFKFHRMTHQSQLQQRLADLLDGRVRQVRKIESRLRSMGLRYKILPDDLTVRLIVVSGVERAEAEVGLDGAIVVRRIGRIEIRDEDLRKKTSLNLAAFNSGIDLELELGQKVTAVAKIARQRENSRAAGEKAVDESEFLTQDDSVLDELYSTTQHRERGEKIEDEQDWLGGASPDPAPRNEITADLASLDDLTAPVDSLDDLIARPRTEPTEAAPFDVASPEELTDDFEVVEEVVEEIVEEVDPEIELPIEPLEEVPEEEAPDDLDVLDEIAGELEEYPVSEISFDPPPEPPPGEEAPGPPEGGDACLRYDLAELVRRFGEGVSLTVKGGKVEVCAETLVDGDPFYLTVRSLSPDRFRGRLENAEGASREVEIEFRNGEATAADILTELKRRETS